MCQIETRWWIKYVGSPPKSGSLKSIPTSSPFPWKSIWRVEVPSRVAFFEWMAALGKILNLDNLRKMNVIVLD
jgi:hypothetical protein